MPEAKSKVKNVEHKREESAKGTAYKWYSRPENFIFVALAWSLSVFNSNNNSNYWWKGTWPVFQSWTYFFLCCAFCGFLSFELYTFDFNLCFRHYLLRILIFCVVHCWFLSLLLSWHFNNLVQYAKDHRIRLS